MVKCRRCDGDGRCRNRIHKDPGGFGTVVHIVTGPLYTCRDCGQSADTPRDCRHCNGTGES